MTCSNESLPRHSRRRFLQVAGVTGFAVTASGLGDYAVAQTPVAIDSYSQAPFFDGQDLPPVAERVSQQPLVLQPIDSVGRYGGICRAPWTGSDTWMFRSVGYDNLVSWSHDWSEVIPNIAHAFEASADGRSYTFHLRPGMKWSDGAPFTSADIAFFVDHIYRNKELTTSLGTNPYSIEVQDDVTFTITWEQPNGFALQDMCTASGLAWVRYPRHYLEQFHADFNTENLDELIEEAGADDWVDLFLTKGGSISGTSYDAFWQNPELPRFTAWQLDVPFTGGTRATVVRNPYYWKVDPDGQQLPYFDEVHFDHLEDNEVLVLRVSNGEADLQTQYVNTVQNKPVLAENRETGQYEFFDLVSSFMNTAMFAVNLTHKDPTKREIFQNKDFRIGLSHAINRQEVIDAVFISQGEPWQGAPREETPWYNEALAKQYTEYDVELANQHLDKVLPDKDGDGMRLKPNGEAFSFVLEVTATDPARVDVSNLVIDYWRAVGLDVSLNPEDQSLFYNRKAANEHDCVVWSGDGGHQDAIMDPRWYMPESSESNFAIAWYLWYRQPPNPQAEPMEPPARVREQMALYDEIAATPDPALRSELFNELLTISQEMFYAIGISLPAPGYGIRKANMRNVMDPMPFAWLYPTPGPALPIQMYFEES